VLEGKVLVGGGLGVGERGVSFSDLEHCRRFLDCLDVKNATKEAERIDLDMGENGVNFAIQFGGVAEKI